MAAALLHELSTQTASRGLAGIEDKKVRASCVPPVGHHPFNPTDFQVEYQKRAKHWLISGQVTTIMPGNDKSYCLKYSS